VTFSRAVLTERSDQRQQVYKALELYITQVGVEHSRQLEGTLPNVQEYFDMRFGTAGVAPVCGCAE
jgi:hypothetical protein